MSDQIRIVLIAAVVVVIALIIYRRRLQKLSFKKSQDGVEAELSAYAPPSTSDTPNSPAGRAKPASVTVKRNRLFGWGNKIEIERDDVSLEENSQVGVNQEITAKSDQSPRKKK